MALAMAAFCALQPLPHQGPHHREDLFIGVLTMPVMMRSVDDGNSGLPTDDITPAGSRGWLSGVVHAVAYRYHSAAIGRRPGLAQAVTGLEVLVVWAGMATSAIGAIK